MDFSSLAHWITTYIPWGKEKVVENLGEIGAAWILTEVLEVVRFPFCVFITPYIIRLIEYDKKPKTNQKEIKATKIKKQSNRNKKQTPKPLKPKRIL